MHHQHAHWYHDSKRCTVALTVSASDEMLTPMVVFKGARHGRIATCEIRDHPQEMKYMMQLKAWFNEVTMLDWVNNVDDVLDNSNRRHSQQQRNG